MIGPKALLIFDVFLTPTLPYEGEAEQFALLHLMDLTEF